MKVIEFAGVNIIKKPLNALEEIQKKSITEIDEEPLYVCDLTDIIKKHRTWTQLLPRVSPFYGKLHIMFYCPLL